MNFQAVSGRARKRYLPGLNYDWLRAGACSAFCSGNPAASLFITSPYWSGTKKSWLSPA